jgi:hypothetical protein
MCVCVRTCMRLHDESRWRIYWSLVIFGLVFWGARDMNRIPHFPFIFVIKDISAVSLFRRNWNPKCPALFARSEWKAAESGTRNYISLYRLLFALKFFFFFKFTDFACLNHLTLFTDQVLLGLAESIFQEQTSLKKLVQLMMSNARNYLHCRRIVIYVFSPSEASVNIQQSSVCLYLALVVKLNFRGTSARWRNGHYHWIRVRQWRRTRSKQ